MTRASILCGMSGLDVLIRDGATVGYLGRVYEVRRVPVGTLCLPSGRVVVADPGTVGADEAVAVTVAPGRYPVVVVNLCDPGSMDCAYTAGLHLMVGGGPVERWEPVAGYAVDRGVAAFLDAAAVPLLDTVDRDDVVFSDGEPYELDPRTGANVVVSDSGGDGFYGVWVGRAADGSVAGVITEFQVIGLE